MDGLTLLPKEEWCLQQHGDVIVAGIYRDRAGYCHSVKLNRSDLPNDLISADDLERIVVYEVDVPVV